MEVNGKPVRGARFAVRGGCFSRAPHTAHRTPVFLALLLALVTVPVSAQQPPAVSKPWFASVSHYGKWVSLAGAGGLLAQGALRHRDADRAYEGLITRCRDTVQLCGKNPDGSYVDTGSEEQYQRMLRMDRVARNWIVAGQATLLVAGTMFLLDLVHDDDGPKNIPYAPFAVYAQPGRLGLTVEF